MIRINISLLKKVGTSGITHWRQVVLLMTADTEKYVVRLYYGRKMDNMKKHEELNYDEFAFANRDFRSFTEQRCADGYEVVEYLCAPMNTKSLAFFKPPRFRTPKGEELHNLFMTNKRRLAIPIQAGMRVYIKIGCETVCSVKAIDAVGNSVILPNNVNDDLQKCVRMGHMEAAILEGYLDKHSVLLTDIAAVNGMDCTQGFEARLAVLRDCFNGRPSLTVCTPKLATENLLDEFDENRCMNVRYYVVKELDRGFDQAEGYAGSTFIAPNFYSMEMIVLERPSYGHNAYKVGLMTESGYHTMGYVESSKPLSESDNVTVNFTSMTEGVVDHAWASDDSSYRNFSFKEGCIDQLYNGSDCWGARLTLHEAV